MIHPTALVDGGAQVHEEADIGPYTIIGPNVKIGRGTCIESHVVIKGPTSIGEDNHIFQFASIGDDPQDKKYDGNTTTLELGDRNTIREYCTINRGTAQDRGVTQLGSDNWLMAYAHIAHDCVLGNDIILANNVAVAGHVHIDDFVIVGGAVGIHQFCKVGAHAFLGAGGIILRDTPPFVMVSGTKNIPQGINSEGLRRRGFDKDEIMAIKRAYKVIYREGNTVAEAVEILSSQEASSSGVALMTEFLKNAERGIIR